MTEDSGFLPCRGGPFSGTSLMAGDDVPEGRKITFSGMISDVSGKGIPKYWHGTYTRKGDVLVWREGIE